MRSKLVPSRGGGGVQLVVMVVVVVAVAAVSAAAPAAANPAAASCRRGHGVETPAEAQVAVVVVLAADAAAAASPLAEPHVSVLVELALVGVVEVHEFGVLEVGHQLLHEGGGEAAFLEPMSNNRREEPGEGGRRPDGGSSAFREHRRGHNHKHRRCPS